MLCTAVCILYLYTGTYKLNALIDIYTMLCTAVCILYLYTGTYIL